MTRNIVRSLTRTRASFLQLLVGAAINIAGAVVFVLNAATNTLARVG